LDVVRYECVTLRLVVVDGIRVHLLGDCWAAFSPASGETVLLNTEAAALLEGLSESRGDIDAAVSAIARDCGVDSSILVEHLQAAKRQLIENGLVRQRPPEH
jgi:hypothetical protein